MRPPERKRPPVRAGADLCWQAGDQAQTYTPSGSVATIPPMIATHIGSAYLATLAAGGAS